MRVTCRARRRLLLSAVCALLLAGPSQVATAEPPAPLPDVAVQPFRAQARRVVQALEQVGAPLSAEELRRLEEARDLGDEASVRAITEVLESRVLLEVHINPESRVKVARGKAKPELVEHGWTTWLYRVHNEGGTNPELRVSSPNAAPLVRRSSGAADPKAGIGRGDVADRWLDVSIYDRRPLSKRLSGLELEYGILELYSRDAGKREALFAVDIGQGSQDLGFRNEVSVLFDVRPSVKVNLSIVDFDGEPTSASLVIKDRRGRVYPSRARRLEPDFFFHDQIYRHSGESVRLPPGTFDVEFGRGPEYLVGKTVFEVPAGRSEHSETLQLRRWIHAKELGWYSGDHHVHAAGCSHYESPTQGVTPESMMRHILGEDLNVGCVLSWGPCWYFQKEFFDGGVHELSRENYVMRYDVEVSGFPSSHAGHLCLLRLKEDDYPGTKRIEEWPSWDLPVLKWGKEQGGVVGFSHSGWGLQVDSDQLPNLEMPPFDGIGANEYIVDVTHDVVDFISTVDTPYVWELNIWYHTLNCGYRARVSGETDFPCIYGERVGLGRVYCQLDGKLDFDRFCDALAKGRSYVGDGRSHIFDFRVDDVEVGKKESELALEKPAKVRVSARVAARLDEEPIDWIRGRHYSQKPYWHIERARIDKSRRVPVELVVNGVAVARQEIEADGKLRDIEFEHAIEHSSWITLRILPSCHTNPIFAIVGGKPVRASKASAKWCLDAVDVCARQKMPRIREAERPAAEAAFEHARQAYRRVLAEAVD